MSKRVYKTPDDMIEGTLHNTKKFGELKVVNYKNKNTVVIKFIGYEDLITAKSGNIRKGAIKNFMMPNIYGIGYFGIGKYSKINNEKAYKTWVGMLERCYCPKFHKKRPTYVKCSVVTEWHNFQNFAEWFYEKSNYEKDLVLDKDVIQQGNKVYSPDKCVFITTRVNSTITDRGALRGKYMLGVTRHNKTKKFKARCKDGSGNEVYLGLFDKEIDAHNTYKVFKYNLLSELAKTQTDERVKKGLLKWDIHKY